MTKYQIATIWLIFAAFFLYMAWREWRESKEELESLKRANFSSGFIKMQGINFEDLAKEINRSVRESHKIAATSYFLAGLVALASFIFSLLSVSTFA